MPTLKNGLQGKRQIIRFTSEIHIARRLIVQGLMWSVPVIVAHIVARHFLEFGDRFRVKQIEPFPFVIAEETLCPCVVLDPTFTVHTDSDRLTGPDTGNVFGGCKLAALITIDNFWRAVISNSLMHGSDNKIGLHGITHGPAHDKSGMPVDDDDQIHETRWRPTIRNVDAPNLIDVGNADATKQVGIGSLLQIALAEIRTGIEGNDIHFFHVSSYTPFPNLFEPLFL